MKSKSNRGDRRTDALSEERIVEAAIGLLDAEGESALTFRALAERLKTGAGAIYWHVENKGELLTAATGVVVSHALGTVGELSSPAAAIRALALALYDAIDAHSWIGAHFSREPWQPAMLQIMERFGGQLQALEVPKRKQVAVASTLLNYVLGVAGQNAANARIDVGLLNRAAFLAQVTAKWKELDPATHPFVHRMADQLREHDDRKQFLEGIDLILAGIATLR